MRITFFLYILLFFQTFSFAQSVAVHAELDTNAMLIGDQIRLNLIVNQPEEKAVIETVDLSVLEKREELEVLNVSPWDTTKAASELILQKSILLTSFDSGYYFIPSIPITYKEFGLQRTLQTEELALSVNTIAPLDSLQLIPIKPIIEEPLKLEDFIPIIGTIAIIGFIVWLIWYFWVRRKKEELPPPPEIVLPAHEIALNALTQLKGERLWQQGKVKAYQSELTHIVREYLENRYDVAALESTTDEILRQLRKVDFDKDWQDKLREMLQMADLVKFAKAEPPADFHGRMMNYAERFVIETKKSPLEEVKEEEEGSNIENNP